MQYEFCHSCLEKVEYISGKHKFKNFKSAYGGKPIERLVCDKCAGHGDTLKHVVAVLYVAIILIHAFAFVVWQVNNPKANQMTFYTRYSDVIRFKTLPEFQ